MKNTFLLIILMCGFLYGCETPKDQQDQFNKKYAVDQCSRREILADILKNLPKGPERLTASGNDWEEVLEQAGRQAYKLSIREREFVKPECRADAW